MYFDLCSDYGEVVKPLLKRPKEFRTKYFCKASRTFYLLRTQPKLQHFQLHFPQMAGRTSSYDMPQKEEL